MPVGHEVQCILFRHVRQRQQSLDRREGRVRLSDPRVNGQSGLHLLVQIPGHAQHLQQFIGHHEGAVAGTHVEAGCLIRIQFRPIGALDFIGIRPVQDGGSEQQRGVSLQAVPGQ